MGIDLRLYAIVDPEQSGGFALPDLARAVVRGGATLVQLRDKHRSTRLMIEEARAIRAAIAPVPLLINDRIDVALAAAADGAHIGPDDMTPQDARWLLGPDAIIGLSIKNVAQAQGVPMDLIDYAGIGAVFATGTKVLSDPPIGPDGLAAVVAALRARTADFPCCGISGIRGANAAAVIGAGADGISVISALSRQPDPAAAAKTLRAIVDEALAKRGA
jgi:thiamine-phosphate pyrophosphorylase